jgi:tetratricopeptide (TPR) repeat protein
MGFADRSFLERAEHTYEEIIRVFPRYGNLGWIYYQLGRVAMASSQIEKAVNLFQQALLSPSHVSALTAYCYERLGFIAFYEWRDLDQALGFLNRAVDTYPVAASRIWLVQAHLRRSRVLRQMQNYGAALKAAEMALALVPSGGTESKHALAETQLTIAELLSSIGGHDREIVNCLQQFTQNAKKPLGVDVTWSRAHELSGDAYFNLGQYDDAVSSYRAALQFNPDHPWEISLLYRIARSYYQQRSYHETIDVVQNMLDIVRADEETINDYRIYDMLGGAQFALGKYDKAADSYRHALELAPLGVDVDKIKTYLDYACERI